jgi:hypothetical protein
MVMIEGLFGGIAKQKLKFFLFHCFDSNTEYSKMQRCGQKPSRTWDPGKRETKSCRKTYYYS